MSARLARNLIAILIVVLYLALLLVLGGCVSTTKIKFTVWEEQPDSSLQVKKEFELEGMPRDWKDVQLEYRDVLTLRVGEAVTVVPDVEAYSRMIRDITRSVVCLENPLLPACAE